jgi:hypothetical protein
MRPDPIGDLGGTLVIAHSAKQDTAAMWKRTFGRHPITGFVESDGWRVVGSTR